MISPYLSYKNWLKGNKDVSQDTKTKLFRLFNKLEKIIDKKWLDKVFLKNTLLRDFLVGNKCNWAIARSSEFLTMLDEIKESFPDSQNKRLGKILDDLASPNSDIFLAVLGEIKLFADLKKKRLATKFIGETSLEKTPDIISIVNGWNIFFEVTTLQSCESARKADIIGKKYDKELQLFWQKGYFIEVELNVSPEEAENHLNQVKSIIENSINRGENLETKLVVGSDSNILIKLRKMDLPINPIIQGPTIMQFQRPEDVKEIDRLVMKVFEKAEKFKGKYSPGIISIFVMDISGIVEMKFVNGYQYLCDKIKEMVGNFPHVSGVLLVFEWHIDDLKINFIDQNIFTTQKKIYENVISLIKIFILNNKAIFPLGLKEIELLL